MQLLLAPLAWIGGAVVDICSAWIAVLAAKAVLSHILRVIKSGAGNSK